MVFAPRFIAFKIACDVTNPLYGKNGAAHVYAKQKGATPEDIGMLDKGLESFSNIIDIHFNIKSQNFKGAGAAGGMGIGTHVFLNGELNSGIELVKEIAQFDKQIKNVDWIITGEGKLDSQTLSGKTITGIIDSAKKESIPIAAFCGNIENVSLDKLGISYADSVMRLSNNLDDAMENSYKYVTEIAKDFASKIDKIL
ncbi:MAG: glycerate kinase [Flavobacteriaceae bacterium]